MKKVILLTLLLVAFGFTKNNFDVVYKKFFLFLPKLANLSNQYPSDPEIHLGIAELYRLNMPPQPYSFKTEYQKVLEIDPLNRPANAIISKNNFESFVLKWNLIFENLEGIKEYMLEYNIGETLIRKNSILYNVLKEGVFMTGENNSIILKLEEFEYAKSILKNVMKNEYENIVREIKKSQRIDSDNALYNYLLASLYFTQDRKEMAIKEIQKGINKRYCSVYEKERMKARMKVLEKINFPWPERTNLIIHYSPFPNWLIGNIWHNRLEKIGKECESTGKFKKAEEIYKMAIFMGKQYERNCLYIGEEIESLKLEMFGYQSLEKLYKKMGEENNREKVESIIKQIKNKIRYFLNLSRKWNQFNREDLSPKELSKLRILINQILEKGEISALSSLK